MTKRRRAIWGVIAVMAIAMAAERLASLSRPEPSVSAASAEARRAIIKQRAESARERLRERQERRAEREARAREREPAVAAVEPVVPTPAPANGQRANTAPAPTTRPTAKTVNRPVALAGHPPAEAAVTKVPAAPARLAKAAPPPPPPAIRPPTAERLPGAAPRKGIPRGFEEWFAPQKTAVDLYYGGSHLMTTLVEYTVDSVTFLNPLEIATRLPGIRSPSEVGMLLAAPQRTHADKVCVRPNQPLCGRLEPATLGVIFDEGRFRADLFLNPSLLNELAPLANRYLPEPVHHDPTLVQNLGALYSGSSTGVDRFSLFGRTRIGHGRGYGFADWVSTDETAISTDQLGYTHDFQDVQFTTGLFEPVIDALRAVPRQPIVGASIARSLLTRTDLDSMIASPIELFIPVRGRVDIFRDGRLISTGFYEAGNQRIDTSRLPGGAYTIDIVITDITGSTRTLQQLFIKSSLMAPPGEPLWFADAGQVMKRSPQEAFPEDYGTMQLRGGYRWRHRPWLGFGAAGALTEHESLVELSAGVLFDWLEGSAEVYGSSAGGSGFGLRGLMRRNELVASTTVQHTTANDPASDLLQYQLLPVTQSLTSLSLTHPFWQGLAIASVTQREDQGGNRSQRSTLGYSRTFPLGGQHSLQVQTEVGDDDGNALALLTVQWRNIRGRWSDSALLRLQQNEADDNADTVSVAGATTWRDGDRFADDVEFSLRGEAGDRNKSVTVDGEHRSQFGRASASLTTADSDGVGQTLVSLGYDTSIVVGQDGKTAWGGGPHLHEAAVLLDLRESPDALLEVSTEGQTRFVARGGRNAALTLAPYQQYRIHLKDRGLALTQFDGAPREVTLYPGHVVNLEWAIRSVRVLIGRVVTPDGQPLANARIEGAEGFAATDEEGFLQTEVGSDVRELIAGQNGNRCRIQLPAPSSKDTLLRAPRLDCMPLTTAPAAKDD
jgi:hypothetical protein